MGLLLGITGSAQSGKDTFAEMLAEELKKQTDQRFVLMAYAHELKLRVQKDFDLSYEQLWGTEKEFADERYRRPEWKHLDGGTVTHWTPREIMQNYGQFYRTIDYGFWVKYLFGVIKQNDYKNVIITDIRYPNEAQPIVDSDGYVIKITRGNKAEIHNQYHSSEISMAKYDKIDFIVGNNDTLDELKHNAVDVVKQIIISENSKKGDF
jgi:hypothetical protein